MACCNIFTTNLIFIGLDIINWICLGLPVSRFGDFWFFDFLKVETEERNLCSIIFHFLIVAFFGLEIFGTIKKNLGAMIAASIPMSIRFMGHVIIAIIKTGNKDYVANICICLIVWETLRIFLQSFIIHHLSAPHLKRERVRKQYASLP